MENLKSSNSKSKLQNAIDLVINKKSSIKLGNLKSSSKTKLQNKIESVSKNKYLISIFLIIFITYFAITALAILNIVNINQNNINLDNHPTLRKFVELKESKIRGDLYKWMFMD